MQDLIKVIQKAIEEEKACKEKYRQLSQTAGIPGIQLIFEQLAQQEEAHEKSLQESLNALKVLYPDVKKAKETVKEITIPPTWIFPGEKKEEKVEDSSKKFTPKKFKDFVKTLTETGFMKHVKDNKLVIGQDDINAFLKENFKGVDRLEDVEVFLKEGVIDLALKIKLLKDQTTFSPVETSVRLKRFQFDHYERFFEFEFMEPRDVVTNSLVGQVLVGILILVLQNITNSRIELGKIIENLNFLDVISTKASINLNESFYLGSIFGSRIKNVKVFDFLKIEQIDIQPGELVVRPVLTMT